MFLILRQLTWIKPANQSSVLVFCLQRSAAASCWSTAQMFWLKTNVVTTRSQSRRWLLGFPASVPKAKYSQLFSDTQTRVTAERLQQANSTDAARYLQRLRLACFMGIRSLCIVLYKYKSSPASISICRLIHSYRTHCTTVSTWNLKGCRMAEPGLPSLIKSLLEQNLKLQEMNQPQHSQIESSRPRRFILDLL